jgi:small subunit ribosomal protein S20
MQIIKSAKKRVKVTAKAQERNYMVRSKFRTAIKALEEFVKGKDKDKSEDALKAAYREIDMAAKKNVLHKNNAARKKSHLSKLVASLSK